MITTDTFSPATNVLSSLLPTPVLISGTTQVGANADTYTVGGTDIPSDSNVTDYSCYRSVGGKNTTGLSQTVHFVLEVNGVQRGDVKSITIAANKYWCVRAVYAEGSLAASDQITFKFWTNNANTLDIRYSMQYIIPRTLARPGSDNMLAMAVSNEVLEGDKITLGVGIITSPELSYSIIDSTTGGQVPFGFTGVTGVAHGKGQYIALTTVDGAIGGNTADTPQLSGITVQKTIRTWSI